MNLLEMGALLKRERERRRLSLRDVMEATKISRRNLNALEDGEVQILPHPVYLKGYVRNYARLLGLDPEPLVQVVEGQYDGDAGYLPQDAASAPVEAPAAAPAAPAAPATPGEPNYSGDSGDSTKPASSTAPMAPAEPTVPGATAGAASPETPVVSPVVSSSAPAASAKPQRETDAFGDQLRFPHVEDYGARRSMSLWPWAVLAVVLVAMGLLYVQYRRVSAELEAQQAPAAAPAAEAQANATPEPPATAAQEPAPAAPPKPESAAKAPVEPGARPAAAAMNASASVQASSVDVSRKAAAQEPRTPGMQELVVTAKPGEACWVEVSDGQMRKSFTLKDGESRRVEFSGRAKVRLGNAGGVSFMLNGAHYPYEGERGQVATVELGAQ